MRDSVWALAVPANDSDTARRRLIAGATVLAFGALVYVVMRPLGAPFLPDGWSLQLSPPAVFVGFFGSLPTFCHVLAFGLMSAALRPEIPAVLPTAIWAVVNLAFEAAQLQGAMLGVFDPLDCLAAVAAPLVLTGKTR